MCDRSTSPFQRERLTAPAGSRGFARLSNLRESAEAHAETLRRLAAVRSQTTFFSVIKAFCFGQSPNLDLSGGVCLEVSDEDFAVAMRMVASRRVQIETVDVSGGCSKKKVEAVLQLILCHRTVVEVRCDCELPPKLMWTIAEACAVNEEYCERAAKVTCKRRLREETLQRQMEMDEECETLRRIESRERASLVDQQRKAYVKLCAVEHMALVSAHRAMKRREQECDFANMRLSQEEVEREHRSSIENEQFNRSFTIISLQFESLKRKMLSLQEIECRLLLLTQIRNCRLETLRREATLMKRHREAIAALSLDEFSSRRDIAVLEAHFRSYLQGIGRDMKLEATKFQTARVLLEDADQRRRRVEWDRLERERHSHKEHVRHEDSRQQSERVRERERFMVKLNQSQSALEREESLEFRFIREAKSVLLPCIKGICAASTAEINLAQLCKNDCGLQLEISGRDIVYVFATINYDPSLETIPWFPLSQMSLTFLADQPPHISRIVDESILEVRSLRKKALQLMEDAERKLFLDPNHGERALFLASQDVGPPTLLDADCCPNSARFLSRRRIVRAAKIQLQLVETHHERKAAFDDALRCNAFDGCDTSVVCGLQWSICANGGRSLTVVCNTVTPDEVEVFSESCHGSLTSAVSQILNRICFRRLVSNALDPSCFGNALMSIRIELVGDGVDETSLDSSTRKFNSSSPISCRSHTSVAEKFITIEVRHPVFAAFPLNHQSIRVCHGFSTVLSHIDAFNSNVVGVHCCANSMRHSESSLSIRIVGDLAVESVSLLLRVEPGTMILDSSFATTGGAFLRGKRVTFTPTPYFFALSSSAFQFPSHESKTSAINIELDDDVSTEDICQLLQQCITVAPVNGDLSGLPHDTRGLIVRVVLHDSQDVACLVDVPVKFNEVSNEAPKPLLLSPNPIRPLTLHPGEDPTLLGVPNTADSQHAVRLMPRLSLFLPPSSQEGDWESFSGTVCATMATTDPNDENRFTIFSQTMKPSRGRASQGNGQGLGLDIVVTETGSSFRMAAHNASLSRLIYELQHVYVSCTHFLLRTKNVFVNVDFDLTVASTARTIHGRIPVEVHEGLAPFNVTKKRLSVTENKGWFSLGPFQLNRPNPKVFCDAFNGNCLRVWIADGKGPEDLIVLKGMRSGTIRLRLVKVTRSQQPQRGATPVSTTSTASPFVKTEGDASPAFQAEGSSFPTGASSVVGKSALLYTPRRKGPLKLPKLDESLLEAAIDPSRDEVLSALSFRFSGHLASHAIDEDVSETMFWNFPPSADSNDMKSNTSSKSTSRSNSPRGQSNPIFVPPLPLSPHQLDIPEVHDVLSRFPEDFMWHPSLKAAWLVREHLRSELNDRGSLGDELRCIRCCKTQSNMIATYQVFRTPTPSTDGHSEEENMDQWKLLGTLTQERSSVSVAFVPPSPFEQPVFAEDVLAILQNVAYGCEPCTSLSSTTKLVECSVRAVDGPEIRFSQLLSVQKTESFPHLSLLRQRLVYEPNTIEMMSIGALPIAPYAQSLVIAHGVSPFFDGGRLVAEIVGGQEGDTLFFMTRDEQLKAKGMLEVWRQEQMFLRSRHERVEANVEDLLHRFTPYEGIGEISASGRLNRTNIQTRTKGDEQNFSIGMTENYNPQRVAVEFGPFQPEHVLATHVMVALNTIGFRTSAGPGERVVRITLISRSGTNAPQTTVRLTIAVHGPQIFIPEGSSGRVFIARRQLKSPLTSVPLFQSVCVSFSKFAAALEGREPVLHQGFLEIRMVGVETGERLSLMPLVGAGTGELPSNRSETVTLSSARFYGRRLYMNHVYVGLMSVATPWHFKLDFEWSSSCTAEHVMLLLKHVHLCVGRGVPVGVSPQRKVEVLLCTGTGRSGGVSGLGCTSIVTSLVTLDAPVTGDAVDDTQQGL